VRSRLDVVNDLEPTDHAICLERPGPTATRAQRTPHAGGSRDLFVAFAPLVGTFLRVDVRIGVTQAPRELTVEVPDDERDDAEKQIEAALGGAVEVLWLTDKRGRKTGVPAAKIAYIESNRAPSRDTNRWQSWNSGMSVMGPDADTI